MLRIFSLKSSLKAFQKVSLKSYNLKKDLSTNLQIIKMTMPTLCNYSFANEKEIKLSNFKASGPLNLTIQ